MKKPWRGAAVFCTKDTRCLYTYKTWLFEEGREIGWTNHFNLKDAHKAKKHWLSRQDHLLYINTSIPKRSKNESS